MLYQMKSYLWLLSDNRFLEATLLKSRNTLGEETSADLDAHLFVGDREGLKKAKRETRKIASTGGAFRYIWHANDVTGIGWWLSNGSCDFLAFTLLVWKKKRRKRKRMRLSCANWCIQNLNRGSSTAAAKVVRGKQLQLSTAFPPFI